MGKKIIKIKFVDFYKGFDYKNNLLYRTLKKNYDVQIVDNPDYLFFSVFGIENYDYNCVKIFYSGENLAPDFNLCDYAVAFEDLQFGDRYFQCPLYFSPKYDTVRNKMQCKHLDVKESDLKRAFCSFVYSNGRADSIRDELFHRISEYKKVDSGGKHLNNVGGPVKSKLDFESAHKFSIACENSSHLGYNTEKLVESFAARTVPIYWGDPGIKKIYNANAFICVEDFESIDDLVQYLEKLDNDPQMYLKMLKTPALVDEQIVNRTFEKLEKFLTNIFDQEYEKAFRRNKVFWGENYTELHRMMKEAYCNPTKYLQHKIKAKLRII